MIIHPQINPQLRIPALNDNGKYLSDSHAISTYLIVKYGNSEDHSLYPKDFYIRARIDQRLHFDSGILFSSLVPFIRSLREEGTFEHAEAHIKLANKALSTVEKFLENDPFLVGNQVTVADLAAGATVSYFKFLVEINAVKYPKMCEWLDRLKTVPYFNETISENVEDFRDCVAALIAMNRLAAEKK